MDVDLTYTTGSEKKLVQIQMQCLLSLASKCDLSLLLEPQVKVQV